MPPSDSGEEIRLAAETWIARRTSAASGFTAKSLRDFVELSDAMARKVIRAVDSTNPEVYEALAELATVAASVVSRRKVFVDGQDATPPR